MAFATDKCDGLDPVSIYFFVVVVVVVVYVSFTRRRGTSDLKEQIVKEGKKKTLQGNVFVMEINKRLCDLSASQSLFLSVFF